MKKIGANLTAAVIMKVRVMPGSQSLTKMKNSWPNNWCQGTVQLPPGTCGRGEHRLLLYVASDST